MNGPLNQLTHSHTHSGCVSLIWHDINTLSIAVYTECHLKFESFSHENDALTHDGVSTVSVRVTVKSLHATLAIKRICSESARRETDRPVMREIGQF